MVTSSEAFGPRDPRAPDDAVVIDALVEQQRRRAASEAWSATAMLDYVDSVRAAHAGRGERAVGDLEASFAADELGLALSTPTGTIQAQLARTRRVRSRLPGVWQLHTEGMIDSYKVFKIDQAAQRLVYGDSLLALDAQVCPVAPDKTPGQLQTWLHRFVDRTEPTEAAQRHRRAFGDRTVYTSPDEDAMGWLNLCHNQLDLAQVDARLTQMARALGADDPRTIDQRKADLAVDLLLGRIPDTTASDTDTPAVGNGASPKPVTGLAKRSETTPATAVTKTPTPSTTIAVVVPIQTLFDESDVPGETVDRQSVVPADVVRQRALEPGTLGAPPGRQAGGVYRLLTDTVGNLLEVTEAGRFPTHKLGFAITCRDGTSRFPTSSVPAARCDLDHTVPYARQPDSKDPTGGPTSADNLGPLDRRTHNAKTRGRIGLRQPRPGEFCWTTSTGHTYFSIPEPLPTAQWPEEVRPANDGDDQPPPPDDEPPPLPSDPEPHWWKRIL